MTEPPVRVVEDYVLVRRDAPRETTEAGLHLPEPESKDRVRGEIIGVGPGAVDRHGNRKPMDVEEGDRVLYYKRAATSIPVEADERLERVQHRDLLAVLEDG